MTQRISHDRLFKELLNTFFVDFLDLFFPELSSNIERDSIVFLDKETITDVTDGSVAQPDIVVKCLFKGSQRFFIIHVENQASSRKDFARRMFKYFARLVEKYGVDVYPIVLFTFDKPFRVELDQFIIRFDDFEPLKFQFRAIQLNRLDWRDFIRRENPVASALMSKMKFSQEDRPKVKFECLRLLATLKLNPAKSRLIYGFVNSYLKLNPVEETSMFQDIESLGTKEKEPMLELTNEFIEKGERIGVEKGERIGLEKGERIGIEKGERSATQGSILLLGKKLLGAPPREIVSQITKTTDKNKLEALLLKILEVKTWQELLAN